jgi:O-antigen/teichoic acid export membrane protein
MSNPFSRLATAKAALLMTGSTYVSFFFGLVVSAIIARAVGPHDFGRYAYIVWISGVLVQVGNNGLNTTGIRFISESLGRNDKDSASAVHGWLARLQFLCLIATTVGFLATLPLSIPDSWKPQVALFAGIVLVSMIAKTLYLFDISIAKGYGEYSVEAYSTMSVSAVNMLCVVAFYFLHAPVAAYMALFAAASAGYALIAWRMLRARRIVPSAQGLDASLAPRLKSHLLWTVLLTVAAAFGNKASETYLLSTYVGPAEVGFFTIAASLTRGGVELLSAGLNTVLMPLMGHGFGEGGATRVNAILANSVRFFTFAGLLLAGVGFMWADVAISLMYGAQYQPATHVFQVMAIVAGITLSQGAFGALLSTTDNQRIRAFVAVLSVGLSVLAAVLLVPRYGLMGALTAHVVSSALIFVLIGVGIVRVFSVARPWRELFRLMRAAASACAVAAACLWFGNGLVLQFVGGLLYAIVFITGSFAFKAWTEDDLTQLLPLADRYPALLGRVLPALAAWVRR